ncbi:MAG: TRAP transporter small permease [Deltaproteobacteria bacterium]|nr:TRAP transporter small permease [Deltaproteobacteria bacterium]
MARLRQLTDVVSGGFNYVACAAVIIMMMLTCVDVMSRLFWQPIPGTYELVGFIGTAVVSFALAYTSIERGHIAVELLVDRLPKQLQFFIEGINSLIGLALFSLIAWQSMVYATDLKSSGEVSLTLEIPTYPFVYGISIGCGMLCVALLVEFILSMRRVIYK